MYFLSILYFILLLSPFAQEGDRFAEYNVVKKGDVCPIEKVVTLDDKTLEFSGKVVLVNFFATWCPPCKAEMPQLQSLWERYSGKDFVLVSIGREEKKEKLLVFQKDMKVSFPMAEDPKRDMYDLFAKGYIPRNYLMDREGKVIYQSVGFTQEEFQAMVEVLDKELEKALSEKKKK